MAISSDLALTVPVITGENKLVIPESTDNLTLADFVPVLTQYREINASMVFEYRDKKGNAEARSHVAKLRRIKAPITEIHKRLKADYKAIIDKMDADKREALAVVEEMIEHHDAHLRIVSEEEAAEAQRKKIEAEISDCWDMARDLNAMHDQQRELARQAEDQAKIAAEQAEAQRKIDQAAREKEIAEKAAAEAKQRAEEDAARQIKEAEAKAAREKVEAAEKAEREKVELEARLKREQAEAEAKVKAEADRKRMAEEAVAADLENTKRVHRAILAVMVEAHGIDEELAKGLILAIRAGEVPALSINYQWGHR